MMGKYVLFDNKGIIHESDSYEDALNEYNDTKDFKGDLILCELLSRRK